MNKRIEFFDHAIVFNIIPKGDRDLIVRFLTPTHGIVTAFAFGARNSKRRFSGCFEELSHVIYKVSSPRHGSYLYLDEGILVNRFTNIHISSQRYGIAKNCQKFLDAIIIGPKEAKKIYDLFLGLLRLLDRIESYPKNLPIFFRARITKEIGYMPEFKSCNRCGRLLMDESYIYFLPEKGKIFCKDCVSSTTSFILLEKRTFNYLLKIFTENTDKWDFLFSANLDENNLAKCLGRFVEATLKVKWYKGRFVVI